jgi:methionyl-tRNA formyltransferase
VRTAYFGTSDFAATVLRRLAALAARELELELLQAEDVNEEGALGRIRAAKPQAVLVCAFGQLIREPLLSEFPMLNVHPSLLPRWRGAAPIERAIMACDPTTGVCVMRLTAGLDSGPVALREEVPIDPGEDFESLSAKLAEVGGELLVRALDLQAKGDLEFVEQDEDGVTYAEKIEPAERQLDPELPARELAAKVRALNPHVGTYLELPDGERLGIRRAQAVEAELESGRLAVRDEALLLGCDEGALQLELVQPPGGKPMPADAYLRGHPLPSQ